MKHIQFLGVSFLVVFVNNVMFILFFAKGNLTLIIIYMFLKFTKFIIKEIGRRKIGILGEIISYDKQFRFDSHIILVLFGSFMSTSLGE